MNSNKIDQRIKDAWAIEKFYKQLEFLKKRSENLRSGKNIN
jgi:hypothetical protein